MGKVYRAADAKLGRDVALKVLPSRFADDAQRLGRLTREAQLLTSLNFAPLLEKFIGTDPSLYAETIPRTFLVMAALFFGCVIGATQFYLVPPAGWQPPGWTPPATAGAALGVMSFFNGIGRLSWGSLSDKLGRNYPAVAMYVVYTIACLALLRTASGFWPLLMGLCMVGFSFGGYLALLLSFTADYFGSKNVGANYGIMFSAYGLYGFNVPEYFAGIMDEARKAGDLAGGYNQVYFTLAVFAVAGAVLALLVKRPLAEESS